MEQIGKAYSKVPAHSHPIINKHLLISAPNEDLDKQLYFISLSLKICALAELGAPQAQLGPVRS